jgi:hypothetical protein
MHFYGKSKIRISSGRSVGAPHLTETAEDLGLLRLLKPDFHLGQIIGFYR